MEDKQIGIAKRKLKKGEKIEFKRFADGTWFSEQINPTESYVEKLEKKYQEAINGTL